jgi:hypothetical protein
MFQNFTLQNGGFSPILTEGAITDLTIRDLVIQNEGGGTIGGAKNAHSRAGDGFDINGSISGLLLERLWIYNQFDVGLGFEGGSPQANITMRNNVILNTDACLASFGVAAAPAGFVFYNNTCVGNHGTWDNQTPPGVQRPDGAANIEAMALLVTKQTGVAILNNVFAEIQSDGIDATDWGGDENVYVGSGDWLDYNDWANRTSDNTGNTIELDGTIGNLVISSWAAAQSPVLEAHGIFIDPTFANPSVFNFAPGAGSPLLGAGKNLCTTVPPGVQNAVGLVWDINRNPRNCSSFTIGAFQ